MADFKNGKHRRCSFCGRSEDEVEVMIPARIESGFICGECIKEYGYYIDEYHDRLKNEKMSKLLTELKKPEQIKAILDEYVVGQDEAKIALSVAVYNHYKRVFFGKDGAKSKKGENQNETADAENVELYLKELGNEGYEAYLGGYVEPIKDVFTLRIGDNAPVTMEKTEDGQLKATISGGCLS